MSSVSWANITLWCIRLDKSLRPCFCRLVLIEPELVQLHPSFSLLLHPSFAVTVANLIYVADVCMASGQEKLVALADLGYLSQTIVAVRWYFLATIQAAR